MSEKTLITQNQIVNQILHIGHGDLSIYTKVGLDAVKNEPELFAHLIAYNHKKGEIRDSKVALPTLALRGEPDAEFYENAAAHLCLLSPKDLVRALRYHKSLPKTNGGGKWLKDGLELYIRNRERNRGWWDRTAVQHRESLKTLYAMNHMKPSDRANKILFKREYPRGSVFERLKELKSMPPQEAAGTILNFKIPFLIAVGALGGIKDKTDVILALIEGMSKAELINNTAALKRWGVMDNPALKAAYDEGLTKERKTEKVSTLKAGRAAEAITDKKLKKKLEKVQEDQLDKKGGIEGDWLVLADRSGSMSESIEVARHVSSILARQVKGQVHLVFFNDKPKYFDVSGKTLEEIKEVTRRMYDSGTTSVGCGLDLIREKNLLVNGIAICSDGGENHHPYFNEVHKRYCKEMGADPTIYMFHVPGARDVLSEKCKAMGIGMEVFKLGAKPDYYALPQLALTMRVGRYALIEDILETKLLRFTDVFK